MKRILVLFGLLLALPFAALPSGAQSPPPASPSPTTPLDGDWNGKSDGGSCNTPLEFALSIEAGMVDGTASDPAARGPVPNPKKSAPPPPTPGLWQVWGIAKPGGFTLRALASVKGTERRETRFNATVQGNSLTLRESGGCGRSVMLTRAGR
jgi:hypothetical protein